MSEVYTEEEKDFVFRAIERLRDSKRGKGIHTVYSGFNAAFRQHFGGKDPRALTDAMVAEGVLAIRPSRGGVMLYKAEEAPPQRDFEGSEALAKILAD